MSVRVMDLESESESVDGTIRVLSPVRVHTTAKRKRDARALDAHACEDGTHRRGSHAAPDFVRNGVCDPVAPHARTSSKRKVLKVDKECASEDARRGEPLPLHPVRIAIGTKAHKVNDARGSGSACRCTIRRRDAYVCRCVPINLSDSENDTVSTAKSSCTHGCTREDSGKKRANQRDGGEWIPRGEPCGSRSDVRCVKMGCTNGCMNECMNGVELVVDSCACKEYFLGKSSDATVLPVADKVEYSKGGEDYYKVALADDVNVEDDNDQLKMVSPDVKVQDNDKLIAILPDHVRVDHVKAVLPSDVRVDDVKAVLPDDASVDDNNEHLHVVLRDDVKVHNDNDRWTMELRADVKVEDNDHCTVPLRENSTERSIARVHNRDATTKRGKKHVTMVVRDDVTHEERVPKVIDLSDEEDVVWCDDALVSKQLSTWYLRNRRKLPWHGCSWYGVWVSEVMLQQTQVAKVIPYWKKWMSKWPTVRALSGAREEDVFEVWMGLGYYRRARNLLTAAKNLHKDLAGDDLDRDPTCAKDLRELQGVGRYTANAVASICFGEKVPVVDCNVQRVLRRCFADFDPSRNATPEWLWTRMEGILGDEPGIVNQAVMELGATHCSIKLPNCSACPIKKFCRSSGNPEVQKKTTLCTRNSRRKKPSKSMDLYVIRTKGRVAVTKFGTGLLSGQWMFPTTEACSQAFGAAFTKFAEASELRGTVRHAFSHLVHEYRVFALTLDDEASLGDCLPITFTDEKLLQPRLTTGQKKVLALAHA